METPTNKLIEAKIQAIDGDRAVLQLADGQIVRWPVSCMNDGVKAGDLVKLSACEIHAAPASPASQTDLAHAVINSIFGPAQS